MQEMADYADATFWPSGAIQAAVAGGFGLVLAIVGWFLPIPIVGWILIIVGGFMFVMAVFTFVHAGRKALRSRVRDDGRAARLSTETTPPGGPPDLPGDVHVFEVMSIAPCACVSRSANVHTGHGQMTMPAFRARPIPRSRRGSRRA